jgi:hypothetical protein
LKEYILGRKLEMIRRYEMGESKEMIQELSDKELNEYLVDARYLRSGFRRFAIAESNRRLRNKSDLSLNETKYYS